MLTRLDLVTSPDKKYLDLASTLLRIHSVLKTFHSGERIQKVTDSPDTCGRKPYPEKKVTDSKISKYVWTEPKYSTSLFMEDVKKGRRFFPFFFGYGF